MARAAKGQWTGPSGCLDDGTQTISGTFKMPNSWSFGDYDAVRKLLADTVVDFGILTGGQDHVLGCRVNRRRLASSDAVAMVTVSG